MNTSVAARVTRRHISCYFGFCVLSKLGSLTLPDLRRAATGLVQRTPVTTILKMISFLFGDRKSDHTTTLSAMTAIQNQFLSCRERPLNNSSARVFSTRIQFPTRL